MHGLLQDLKYALRMVARAPGFTAVVAVTLALGIGANTAIFSVVYSLLLRPLPYRDPDRIAMVWQDMTARGGPGREYTTPGNFVDLAGEHETFESVAAVRGWQPTITGLGDPEPLVGIDEVVVVVVAEVDLHPRDVAAPGVVLRAVVG